MSKRSKRENEEGVALLELERLVRAGAHSFAESLHFYWPSTGNNEVPEQNVTVHLGRAFLDEGFFVYSQAHTRGTVDVHLDLLALSPARRQLVAGEFKRLYSTAQVRSLADDVARVLNFEPQDAPELRHPGLVIERSFGIVGGTTWKREYAAWFLSDDPQFKDPTGGELDRIWSALPAGKTRWGAPVLLNQGADVGAPLQTQWFVYALFPI